MASSSVSSTKLTIAVLYGGLSAEREISIKSGQQVAKALKKLGYKVVEIDVDRKVALKLIEVSPDIAFVALHGPLGEDGTIQGMLEVLGIRYTGSRVLASALGIDKSASKRIFAAEGLPTTCFIEITRPDEIARLRDFSLPAVIKPNRQGSSVGITIVKEPKNFDKALAEAFQLDDKVLIEEYVDGREIQCGILGNAKPIALEPIEIISKKEFFDFEAKYDSTLAEEVVPAPISSSEKKMIEDLSLKAYKALGCRGFGRVDTFLTEGGKVYVSEVNTIPGLTENSLFPKEAEASGISFEQLVQKIVELGLE